MVLLSLSQITGTPPKEIPMAKRAKKNICITAGVKANGRLKKGYRWAKGRKHCAIKAKKH